MLKVERSEFASLFQEFAGSYTSTPDDLRYVEAYEKQRREGRQNFEAVRREQIAIRREESRIIVDDKEFANFERRSPRSNAHRYGPS